MDYNKLNLSRDKDIIIPRALFATTEETFETDIQKLEELYSAKDIVKYLKLTTENISNKVCISVAKRYNVKPFHRFSL
jgi:formate dehydrogenase maturation protein FdhE